MQTGTAPQAGQKAGEQQAAAPRPDAEARLPALLVISEDWYFHMHWLDLARQIRAAGFELTVACRVAEHRAALEAEGFAVEALHIRRSSLNPFSDLRTVAQLHALMKRLRPVNVTAVAIKPILYGNLAARLARVPTRVSIFAGLGYLFSSADLRARALRGPVLALLRLLLQGGDQTVLVQNADDRAVLCSHGLGAGVGGGIAVMPGVGIDMTRFQPLPEPDGPVTVAIAARMIADKGIATLVEAHALLRAEGLDTNLLLAGRPDPGNPTSLTEAELQAFAARPGVRWLNHVSDIRTLWAEAHIAALPSRREGLPVSLVEAAACSRPLVATDVPGCRDVVEPGETGLLCPPDDARALADALRPLVQDGALRARLGANARALIEARFSNSAVGQQLSALYSGLAARLGRRP